MQAGMSAMMKIEQEPRTFLTVRAIGSGIQNVLFADPRTAADVEACVRAVRAETMASSLMANTPFNTISPAMISRSVQGKGVTQPALAQKPRRASVFAPLICRAFPQTYLLERPSWHALPLKIA